MKSSTLLVVLLLVSTTAYADDAGPEAAPDGGVPALADAGAPDALPPPPPPVPPPVPAPATGFKLEEITAVGTRESRTAGSAHILKRTELERLRLDNPETVVKAVPGVYTRGEDGFGLRPNIGIRGTSPDRSKKLTLMEDGVLFGPAPYSAPAAYYFPLINRMEAVRVIKGPGAVVFGPQTVGGAIDLVTRSIPVRDSGSIDLAGGQYGYGRLQAHYGTSGPRGGYVIEGVHLRNDGFKTIDGAPDANTGFVRNEWMWKGRYALSTDPAWRQQVGLKLGYSDEDSHETYLGLTDSDFRASPYRRYAASRLDRMQWHRTQIVGTYEAQLGRDLTLDVAVYRHDLARTWRKVNRFGDMAIADVLGAPTTARNRLYYGVLTGELDSLGAGDTIYIGPNNRTFVSQGVQARLSWRGTTGPVSHRAEVGVRMHYDRIDRHHTEDGFLMRGGRLVHDGRATRTVLHNRAWANALAVHAADALSWGPVTLTPGMRVELISTALRDRLAGREREGAAQRVFIPGVGGYVALTPSLGMLAGAYSGFSPAAPGEPASVKPERSVNYEAGARFASSSLRAEAIGFFNDYNNLTSICTVALCGPEQVDVQYNAGRARIWGAETFVQGSWKLGGGWVLPVTGAYTFTRTKLESAFRSEDPTLGDVAVGDELPYVPRHQAVATVGVDGRQGGFNVGFVYTSAMREQAGQGTIPDNLRTDEFLQLNARLMARLGRHGEAYLSVQNLTGADDLTARRPFGARPAAPRWVQLGTRWTF